MEKHSIKRDYRFLYTQYVYIMIFYSNPEQRRAKAKRIILRRIMDYTSSGWKAAEKVTRIMSENRKDSLAEYDLESHE